MVKNNIYYSIFYRAVKETNFIDEFNHIRSELWDFVRHYEILGKENGICTFFVHQIIDFIRLNCDNDAKAQKVEEFSYHLYFAYLRPIILEIFQKLNLNYDIKNLFNKYHCVNIKNIDELLDFFYDEKIDPFFFLNELDNGSFTFTNENIDYYNSSILKHLHKSYYGI